MSETKILDIQLLEFNKGQIEGLPKNPRMIRDARFDALKKSIQDAPEMLNLRELIVYPLGGKYVTICGNMRLKACKELNYVYLPCKILETDTPPEKLREYAIKDNIAFGDDDWDSLAGEWETQELLDWGVELPDGEILDEEQTQEEEPTFKETQFIIEVVCKNETEQNEIFSKLDAQGFEVRFKTK